LGDTRYVQIICGVCGGKTLAIGGLPRPTECGLCKTPFETRASESQPTEPAVKGTPATFSRGTFTNIQTRRPRTGPAPKVTGTPKPRPSDSADGGLKEKLMRLFTPRS
jgi:hypothetical protein